MQPKICVSITARSSRECLKLIDGVSEKADLIELRMDWLKNPEVGMRILKECDVPAIATLRPVWEGGLFKGSESERRKLLVEAACHADYVDVELDAKILVDVKKTVEDAGGKLIVSKHDFKKTPPLSELDGIVDKERKRGADVCKLVTTATSFSDNRRILELILKKRGGGALVAFCMGEMGIASRILSPVFGAAFTFACVDYGKEAAPGQVSVDDLREIYKVIACTPQKQSSAA